MKKILCLIDGLSLGGAERQLIGLASLLKEKGYSVIVASYHGEGFYSDLLEKSRVKNVVLTTGGNKISKLWSIRRFISNEGNIDCIITYKDGPSIIGCLLKLLGGRFKLIVSERNTNQSTKFSDIMKFTLYRFSDYIVPNSFTQSNYIRNNFNYLRSKIVTITNFTDTDFFIPTNTQNEVFTIMTAARVCHQKNVLSYLEAAKKVIDNGFNIRFEWYGKMPVDDRDYTRNIQKKVMEYGLDKSFFFYPPTQDIRSRYQSCDIFCLPSLYEGFPNSLCEAMSCGKPILCSSICDNETLVKDSINGFTFDPLNPNDIAAKISKIVSLSPKVLKTMGIESRRIAEDILSKQAFVDKYTKLIET